MSLLVQSDQRRGENISGQVLVRKIEQVLINYGIYIKNAFRDNPANNTNPERLEFANQCLNNVSAAMNTVLPYVTQNATVNTQGGDISQSDIEWVVQTEVNNLYPAMLPSTPDSTPVP